MDPTDETQGRTETGSDQDDVELAEGTQDEPVEDVRDEEVAEEAEELERHSQPGIL